MSLCFNRYLFCCSYSHNVVPKWKFIAFVSTEAETDHPDIELKPGIDLLGRVDELFFDTYDGYEPVNEPSLDNCFISTVSLTDIICSYNYQKKNIFYAHFSRRTLTILLSGRAMVLQLILNQLLWMFFLCIPRSPEG